MEAMLVAVICDPVTAFVAEDGGPVAHRAQDGNFLAMDREDRFQGTIRLLRVEPSGYTAGIACSPVACMSRTTAADS